MTPRIFIITHASKIVRTFRIYILHLKGYKNIDKNAIIESNVKLDKIHRGGVFVGCNTLIASGTTILTHEHVYRNSNEHDMPYVVDTHIGERCFIGVGSMILPGVTIGNECIIGAGSVVTKDIPANSMAVGVPAKIIRFGIRMDNMATLVVEGTE